MPYDLYILSLEDETSRKRQREFLLTLVKIHLEDCNCSNIISDYIDVEVQLKTMPYGGNGRTRSLSVYKSALAEVGGGYWKSER
jgi:DNA mismatch repair protein MutH